MLYYDLIYRPPSKLWFDNRDLVAANAAAGVYAGSMRNVLFLLLLASHTASASGACIFRDTSGRETGRAVRQGNTTIVTDALGRGTGTIRP
jgi:hypothetical protein